MPEDKAGFVKKIRGKLPKRKFEYYGGIADANVQDQYVKELAEKSLEFIQFYEAKRDVPTLKDFRTKFKHYFPVLHDDIEQAWIIYTSSIQRIL